ncbi:MAG TPA: hypothetical protein PLT46_07450, partial [Burkholderiaceae bacterium]|nr:hypothetical protein [Burkholderiaceae bacterium]
MPGPYQTTFHKPAFSADVSKLTVCVPGASSRTANQSTSASPERLPIAAAVKVEANVFSLLYSISDAVAGDVEMLSVGAVLAASSPPEETTAKAMLSTVRQLAGFDPALV